jgi:hypothetical protein|tara:strand:+ start:208 stop:1074 length:867 start_codon:yes stop_codon:yes gene_type:complete
MIFWRVFNNKLYGVENVDRLGFDTLDASYMPDEYLEKQEFVVLRAAHGLGDWGIISAIPRLLKQKYPNCKVYIPSTNLLQELFGKYKEMWPSWGNPFENSEHIFKNNPYVDEFVDSVDGDIFHDHYRIYDTQNSEIPLTQQILKFWQFNEDEYEDYQPELYFTDDEIQFGNNMIREHTDGEFGTLLLSDRYESDTNNKITKVLKDNDIPYFYWTSIPIKETSCNFVKKALDLRHVHPRIQLYIKSKAKLNVGNQCGVNDSVCRYTKTYTVPRSNDLRENFIKGQIYLR